MMPSYCVPAIQTDAFPYNSNLIEQFSTGINMPRAGSPLVRYVPIEIDNRLQSTLFDDDPLTEEELRDAEKSERDFERDQAQELPAEMSDEEFLAYFRSL